MKVGPVHPQTSATCVAVDPAIRPSPLICSATSTDLAIESGRVHNGGGYLALLTRASRWHGTGLPPASSSSPAQGRARDRAVRGLRTRRARGPAAHKATPEYLCRACKAGLRLLSCKACFGVTCQAGLSPSAPGFGLGPGRANRSSQRATATAREQTTVSLSSHTRRTQQSSRMSNHPGAPDLLPSAISHKDRPQSTPPAPQQATHSRNASNPQPGRKGTPLRSSTSSVHQSVDSPVNGTGMTRIPSESGTSRTRATLSSNTEHTKPAEPLNLLKLAGGVVKSRNGKHISSPPSPPHPFAARSSPSFSTGSVLSRGFILKSDHLPAHSADVPVLSPSSSASPSSGGGPSSASQLLHLRGAANFRAASLGVYGVAQPTETGLRTILNVLRSQPTVDGKGNRKRGSRETVWFSSREEACVYIGAQPFVSASVRGGYSWHR